MPDYSMPEDVAVNTAAETDILQDDDMNRFYDFLEDDALDAEQFIADNFSNQRW